LSEFNSKSLPQWVQVLVFSMVKLALGIAKKKTL